MKNKYRAVIIGCGRIAGGYDGANDKNILTHAHALSRHKKTMLSGVYDISFAKARAFARKWNTRAYSKVETMFEVVRPEIVFVCVPDKEHLRMLNFILKFKPKAVICEKPLGIDVCDARQAVAEYRQKRIALAVNYTRRFYPAIQQIREDIKRGRFGKLINASAFYTKGTLHNGSHAIDLLRYFFKEISGFKVLSGIIDFTKDDPTLDARLYFKNKAKAYLIGLDEKEYSIFEVDLLFSKSRVVLSDDGAKYSFQKVIADSVFPGYRCLGEKKFFSSGRNKALLSLIDNVINHIENGETLLSSGEDALKTQEICCRLIKRYKNGK